MTRDRPRTVPVSVKSATVERDFYGVTSTSAFRVAGKRHTLAIWTISMYSRTAPSATSSCVRSHTRSSALTVVALN